MDTQGPNPWSFQRLQVQLPKYPYTTDDTNDIRNTNNNDYSFDSTATTPHTEYDTHAHPKNIFYEIPARAQESDATLDYSVEGHVRTWSYQDTLTNSDHDDDEGEDEEEDEPATTTTSSASITNDQLVLSSSKEIKEMVLAETPIENGDMLEHLVQRLQSEVADTRAIVQDLESRLNAAEGTLVGSDGSDSESSALVSSKHGSEEDSNVVYNRICHALQSLIAEAQSALMRSSSLSPMEKQQCRMNHRQHQITHPSEGTARSTNHLVLFVDENTYLDQCNHFSCRPSRRNSLTHGRIDKALLYPSPPSITSNSSSRSVYSTSSELSRILWKEKQQEQYDRYRRSCDMVSLELQLLLNDSAFDSDQSDTSALSSSSTKAHSLGHTASSSTTMPRSSMSSHQRNRDGPGSKAGRMHRRYQVQFLNPNVQRRPREDGLYKPKSRNYKNQGAGASRSQSILMQLYNLWKHTWLRNRFMHVLTSSVEVLVILLIVIKVSQASLTWMGVRLDKSQNLLTYIYGHRQGPGAAAKELYEKIRKDGLRFTHIRLQHLFPETETLVQDVLLGDKPPTPFTPAGMVLGPAKRMLAHTMAGVALAYVSENVRHVAMKL
ncbi:hypothetical protein BG006_005362 [Podila minutissima]|uniref:Uncharacterized protein n=1 Tax=Podila minutissima TaxID=64525 RepID=A0A9P5SL02_9FUNG|nr:hypothetical protein BG006_005362 [Podila minutissima]